MGPSTSTQPRGVGLGLRGVHVAEILRDTPAIPWFELITDNYLVDGGPARARLEAITATYPVVLHGVAMYVGDAGELDRAYLRRVRDLVRRVKPAWISEHLCWGSADGRISHDLLPLPQTPAVARHVARKLAEAQDLLEVPILVENVSSYAAFATSTMSEPDFVAEVVERADCGLLLDVNNLYVSSQNHAFDPRAALARLPLGRVRQLHLAGHTRTEIAGKPVIIDTHAEPVCDAVWSLYADVVARCGPVPTLLERDAAIPDLATLRAEAAEAERVAQRHAPRVGLATTSTSAVLA